MIELNDTEKYKDPKIVIKNYSFLFNLFMPLLLGAVAIALYIIWKYLRILAVEGGEGNYSFYASIVAIIFFISYVVAGIRNFKKKPPVFIFEENQIIYDYYKDDYRHRRTIKKDIKDIVKIEYILHAEAPYQYGIVNEKSLIKRFFKDDIGDNFIHLVVYYMGFISLLVNLPIKIMILLKNKEPLSLLYNNVFIEFNDGTAMIVNTYSMNNYKKISKIFDTYGKKIDNHLVFNIYLKEKEF